MPRRWPVETVLKLPSACRRATLRKKPAASAQHRRALVARGRQRDALALRGARELVENRPRLLHAPQVHGVRGAEVLFAFRATLRKRAEHRQERRVVALLARVLLAARVFLALTIIRDVARSFAEHVVRGEHAHDRDDVLRARLIVPGEDRARRHGLQREAGHLAARRAEAPVAAERAERVEQLERAHQRLAGGGSMNGNERMSSTFIALSCSTTPLRFVRRSSGVTCGSRLRITSSQYSRKTLPRALAAGAAGALRGLARRDGRHHQLVHAAARGYTRRLARPVSTT